MNKNHLFKRVFLVVLDSLGVGATEDAAEYGDKGTNTLLHILEGKNYNLDVLERFGLTTLVGKKVSKTRGLYMRAKPINQAKDTLNGHYEIMGAVSPSPYKTYPDGFPLELISEIQRITGRDVIGNVVASGTEIIKELGEMQIKTGSIIVYTSADSVLQIAAHTDTVPLEELYEICQKVRSITANEKYKIARIIARPFSGKKGSFYRTPDRKDYALDPPRNALDLLYKNNIKIISVGKIADIFNNKSIDVKIKTKDNLDGMFKLIDFAKGDFEGLLFANLNDFDMLYGHRRDRDGYLKALEEFNYYLPIFIKNLNKDDLLILCADHGNDPTHTGTDHTREYIPIIIYNKKFKKGIRMDDRDTFADIGASILDVFNIKNDLSIGKSIFRDLQK